MAFIDDKKQIVAYVYPPDGAPPDNLQKLSVFAYMTDGVVGAPALTWKDDLDTGIYRISADIIGFATGGVERLRINDAGNLGLAGVVTAGYPSGDVYSPGLIIKGGSTYIPVFFRTAADVFSAVIRADSASNLLFGINAGVIVFHTGANGINTEGTERIRITNAGELFIGNATSIVYGRSSQPVIVNRSADYGGQALNSWNVTPAQASLLDFNRSKSATLGNYDIVASGDALGYIGFRGSDGAAFIPAAEIRAEVDGTPGTNDMPGRLIFSTTADGVAAVTERLRINSVGVATFSGEINLSQNASLVSAADLVKLGGYDLSAGNRTLALATETAVATDAALVSSHSLTIRINGTNYKIPLVA